MVCITHVLFCMRQFKSAKEVSWEFWPPNCRYFVKELIYKTQLIEKKITEARISQ